MSNFIRVVGVYKKNFIQIGNIEKRQNFERQSNWFEMLPHLKLTARAILIY